MKKRTSRTGIVKALAAALLAASVILAVGCSGGGGTGGGNSGDSGAQRGQELYKSAKLGCSNCHKINGQGGAVGPDLSKIGSVAGTRKPGMTAEAYLKESITDSGAFIVSGFPNAMQKYSLPDQDLNDLVAYLMTLK